MDEIPDVYIMLEERRWGRDRNEDGSRKCAFDYLKTNKASTSQIRDNLYRTAVKFFDQEDRSNNGNDLLMRDSPEARVMFENYSLRGEVYPFMDDQGVRWLVFPEAYLPNGIGKSYSLTYELGEDMIFLSSHADPTQAREEAIRLSQSGQYPDGINVFLDGKRYEGQAVRGEWKGARGLAKSDVTKADMSEMSREELESFLFGTDVAPFEVYIIGINKWVADFNTFDEALNFITSKASGENRTVYGILETHTGIETRVRADGTTWIMKSDMKKWVEVDGKGIDVIGRELMDKMESGKGYHPSHVRELVREIVGGDDDKVQATINLLVDFDYLFPSSLSGNYRAIKKASVSPSAIEKGYFDKMEMDKWYVSAVRSSTWSAEPTESLREVASRDMALIEAMNIAMANPGETGGGAVWRLEPEVRMPDIYMLALYDPRDGHFKHHIGFNRQYGPDEATPMEAMVGYVVKGGVLKKIAKSSVKKESRPAMKYAIEYKGWKAVPHVTYVSSTDELPGEDTSGKFIEYRIMNPNGSRMDVSDWLAKSNPKKIDKGSDIEAKYDVLYGRPKKTRDYFDYRSDEKGNEYEWREYSEAYEEYSRLIPSGQLDHISIYYDKNENYDPSGKLTIGDVRMNKSSVKKVKFDKMYVVGYYANDTDNIMNPIESFDTYDEAIEYINNADDPNLTIETNPYFMDKSDEEKALDVVTREPTDMTKEVRYEVREHGTGYGIWDNTKNDFMPGMDSKQEVEAELWVNFLNDPRTDGFVNKSNIKKGVSGSLDPIKDAEYSRKYRYTVTEEVEGEQFSQYHTNDSAEAIEMARQVHVPGTFVGVFDNQSGQYVMQLEKSDAIKKLKKAWSVNWKNSYDVSLFVYKKYDDDDDVYQGSIDFTIYLDEDWSDRKTESNIEDAYREYIKESGMQDESDVVLNQLWADFHEVAEEYVVLRYTGEFEYNQKDIEVEAIYDPFSGGVRFNTSDLNYKVETFGGMSDAIREFENWWDAQDITLNKAKSTKASNRMKKEVFEDHFEPKLSGHGREVLVRHRTEPPYQRYESEVLFRGVYVLIKVKGIPIRHTDEMSEIIYEYNVRCDDKFFNEFGEASNKETVEEGIEGLWDRLWGLKHASVTKSDNKPMTKNWMIHDGDGNFQAGPYATVNDAKQSIRNGGAMVSSGGTYTIDEWGNTEQIVVYWDGNTPKFRKQTNPSGVVGKSDKKVSKAYDPRDWRVMGSPSSGYKIFSTLTYTPIENDNGPLVFGTREEAEKLLSDTWGFTKASKCKCGHVFTDADIKMEDFRDFYECPECHEREILHRYTD